MDLVEIRNEPIVKEFFENMNYRENTIRNYTRAFMLYTEYTKKTIAQILDDVPYEYSEDRNIRESTLKKDLIGFKRYLMGKELAPMTIKMYESLILSFMREQDVSIPRLPRNRGKARTLDENNTIPTIEQLRTALRVATIFERAILLVGLSSGLSASDIKNLTVGQFKEGYDPNTGITTFKIRRKKTDVPFITFLTPEASEAVRIYIKHRSLLVPNKNSICSTNHREKYKIRSDDDKLFIKYNIDNHYLETLDDSEREFTPTAFFNIYHRISDKAGVVNPTGAWGVIRSHNMRKWFNSQLLNAGADSFFVEYIMGHQLSDTQVAYFRPNAEKLKEIYMKYVSALAIQPALDLDSSEEYQAVVRENRELAESKGRDHLRQDMTDRRLKILEEKIAALVDAAVVLSEERGGI